MDGCYARCRLDEEGVVGSEVEFLKVCKGKVGRWK